ncbi:MAG: branched-chain amino acid ABC transporter permease, partial [Pseudomonadota bacterium]|nr:branched-chain amino acid ABC transporter permease [Pseudomonadota bacterium]
MRALVWLLPVALLGLPFLLDDYLQYVVNLMLVYVLVGVGFNIVIGNLGQLAFANAALFGIGAYATGLLMYHLKAPFLLALVVGAVAGGIAGALISLPALRGIRAFYLAIITLAFGELMRWTYI